MAEPVRIFISHSSDDAPLAQALADGLRALPDVEVWVDLSGLEAGRPWQPQLHEAMARCGAGVVLLTPAVLARPAWVLKEAIILAWRLDLDPKFHLYFAYAPGTTADQFTACGFELAQLKATQFLPGTAAELTQVDAMVDMLHQRLPKAQPPTMFDGLISELVKLLRQGDQSGTTYPAIAQHLGIATPAPWGSDRLDKLAEEIARAIVVGREQSLAINDLIDLLGAWNRESREKLVKLLVPFWIDAQAAGSLMRHRPPPAPFLPATQGPGAVTIAGQYVPEFTAQMTVRRAFGLKHGDYRMGAAVGLAGGDLYDDIRAELCAFARSSGWAPPTTLKDDAVVEKLRTSAAPIFVPLLTLPDPATIARLRAEFPRALFVAPRPAGAAAAAVPDLTPEPSAQREAEEHEAWEKALNAIQNY